MNDRAFPHHEKNDDGSHYYSHGGMDLRDYFAGQALMGLLADGRIWPDEAATKAYAHADAMLKIRHMEASARAYARADAMLKIRNMCLGPSGNTGE